LFNHGRICGLELAHPVSEAFPSPQNTLYCCAFFIHAELAAVDLYPSKSFAGQWVKADTNIEAKAQFTMP
jgi:hypothetical protein